MTATKLANPNKLFPMFTTAKLAETRAFYVDKLGWTPTYDMPCYLQVRSADVDGPELAFMSNTGGPTEGAPAFPGQGVCVSVPVADADAHHVALRARGVEPEAAPTLEPWGWRSFKVRDPAGVILDFFHVAAEPATPPN